MPITTNAAIAIVIATPPLANKLDYPSIDYAWPAASTHICRTFPRHKKAGVKPAKNAEWKPWVLLLSAVLFSLAVPPGFLGLPHCQW